MSFRNIYDSNLILTAKTFKIGSGNQNSGAIHEIPLASWLSQQEEVFENALKTKCLIMSRNLISAGKNFRFLVWLPVIISLSMTTQAFCSDALQARECVILLHGLGRTYRSMAPMARALAAAGYKTVNIDYKSREHSIEQLAMAVIPKGLDRCSTQGAGRIHFVTHSMGGILVRYYLSQKKISGLDRVVMLSPPNQGSEVTDALQDRAIYRWFNGPAGQQLGTGPGSFVIGLGPVRYPVGVIAGSTYAFFDFWLADLMTGPNDGKVSVERAKVEGMADFLALPYSHPFIMKESEVIQQTIYFLQHGRFKVASN
jgi:triacylglycerol lipase